MLDPKYSKLKNYIDLFFFIKNGPYSYNKVDFQSNLKPKYDILLYLCGYHNFMR